MLFAKPSGSSASSSWNGVATMGQTPWKLLLPLVLLSLLLLLMLLLLRLLLLLLAAARLGVDVQTTLHYMEM